MPTKTDRILSRLPGVYKALPAPSALYSVADAFGGELLQAENSLAAVMLAHWVDHADKGAEFIHDLQRIGALYGLAPRPDETVEEFRAHLKRYVRIFLDGPSTVQGVLRVAAESLSLPIADDYASLDTWWTRPDDSLTTVETRGDDAAALVFGLSAATAAGQPSRPAQVIGTVDAALIQPATLRLKIDREPPVSIPLPDGASLDSIIRTINTTCHHPVARADGARLTLTSPTLGAASRLEVIEGAADAAPALLGLRLHTYHGGAAASARVVSVDFGAGLDLRDERFLRLIIDNQVRVEVDCADGAADAGHVGPGDVASAINAALTAISQPAVATVEGSRLVLTSPTRGFASSLTLDLAAAQDARSRLFGAQSSFHTGRDAQPADITGSQDLSGGANLSERSQLRLRLDTRAPVTVNCVGENPATTRLDEIVAALNRALGANVASHDGRFLRLTSPTPGPDSLIAFEPLPPAVDATETLLGIRPRVAQGAAATRARLTGARDLPDALDLRAVHQLGLAIDGGPLVEIDLRGRARDAGCVALEDVAEAINTALPQAVASRDGDRLVLTSPTPGAASRVEVRPLTTTRRRRFVTRALVTSEAAQRVLGFVTREAAGAAGVVAQVSGERDLSRGVDLRQDRYLRLSVDGGPPVDIDCAARSPRPRLALPTEIVQAINDRLSQAGVTTPVATTDGRGLTFTSPSAGRNGRIAFEPARGLDAGARLLGEAPATLPGRPATGVSFLGVVDLSQGLELVAHATLRLRVDDVTSETIDLTGDQPARLTLTGLCIAINVALQATVARPDGAFIRLATPSAGSQSALEFLAPETGEDVTRRVFGVPAGRRYHGADAAPPQIVGQVDLTGGADLPAHAVLALSLNGQRLEIDLTGDTGGHTSLADLKAAINTPARGVVADDQAGRLVLRPAASDARLALLPVTQGDARSALLGASPAVTPGQDAAPATLTGLVDLLKPADLGERRALRLAVDGGAPFDVDIAGSAPEATTLGEIVARLNAVVPGLASATDEARLRLTSPTTGPGSRLSLLPVRALELIEYPAQTVADAPRTLQHGARWSLDNPSAAESDVSLDLLAPQGAVGPTFVNRTTGQRLRLLTSIPPGGRLRLWPAPTGLLQAAITQPDGGVTPVPPEQILSGPLGAHIRLIQDGTWPLSGAEPSSAAALQLDPPAAPALTVLRALRFGPEDASVRVAVAEGSIPAAPSPAPTGQTVRLIGRLRAQAVGYQLVDAAGAPLAQLRPGQAGRLAALVDRVAVVSGPLYPAEAGPPVMVVERAAEWFDVTLTAPGAPPEVYAGVTIGRPDDEQDGLVGRVNRAGSGLVWAESVSKRDALRLPVGRSDWLYLDCYGARFDRDRVADPARRIDTRFPGAVCQERGVFDISRFAPLAGEAEEAVFAASGPLTEGAVEVTLQRTVYQPGAFVVNLPADLPPDLGGRFDEARFGSADDQAKVFRFVTEPSDDPEHPAQLIGDHGSALVKASVAPRAAIGFEPVSLPFRHPRTRTLSGGTAAEPAKLYLKDDDVPDLILLEACEPGEAGNAIAVTVTKVDPAHFDMTISYQGGRFESARLVALIGQSGVAPTLPAAIADLLKPGPVGALHAKAAGVQVDVTRDRTV